MSAEPPEISILDARLAEIDRRLSSIQTGLMEAEGERPPPPLPPPAPAPPPPGPPAAAELPPRVPVEAIAPPAPSPPGPPVPSAEPAALLTELHRLADLQEQVLDQTRRLLAAYEATLARRPPGEARVAAVPAGAAAAPVQEFSVSAGPFGSTEALRAFERMLERIPEVREVEVRGYEGADRAIVDVHLFEPKP
jgi:hypothetical protein